MAKKPAKKSVKKLNPLLVGLDFDQLAQLIKDAQEYHDELKSKRDKDLIGNFPESEIFVDFVKKAKLLDAKMNNLPEEKVTFTIVVSKKIKNNGYGIANVLLDNCYVDQLMYYSIDVNSVEGEGFSKQSLRQILEETQEVFDGLCDEGQNLFFSNSLKQKQNIEAEISSLVSSFEKKLQELDLDAAELEPALIKAGLL